MKFCLVKCDNFNNNFYCSCDFDIKNNSSIIFETEKGLMFGKVIDVRNNVNFDVSNKVIRISNKKDFLKFQKNKDDEKTAVKKCSELKDKYKLNMKILDAYYNFDRSQLVFRFISDERVDFRDLAKELGSLFKTRIELRQVGIRDKAKEVGGFGPCGRRTCCSLFLKTFDSISINMAKNQGVLLNPSKINGVCGRLLCCLKYENENYLNMNKRLPKVGEKIKEGKKNGKVVSVNILENKYKILFENGNILEVDNNDSKK